MEGAGRMSPYLTIQEVAELARCEHRTVRRAIRSEELKASLIGRRWIVRDSDVDEWFEARANNRLLPSPDAARPEQRSINRSGRDTRHRPGSVADLEAIRERILRP
jgi:excisionase family DNA binding protein